MDSDFKNIHPFVVKIYLTNIIVEQFLPITYVGGEGGGGLKSHKNMFTIIYNTTSKFTKFLF